MRSLRRQLSAWLLGPLLVLWLVNAWVTYQTSIEAANRAHDRTLYGSVLAIAERISVVDGEVVVDLPYSSLEMLESNIQSRVFYRVSHVDGRQITGYEDLPRMKGGRESDIPSFHDAEFRGEPVRIASLVKRIYDDNVKDPVLIQVAETAELRQSLSNRILIESVLQELALIVLAALLIWLAVNRGLRSLNELRDQVGKRERDDLTPIDASLVPQEVKPLIVAINEHTQRLSLLIDSQKQFIADASHQLKTPLALLHMQADFALRQEEPEAVHHVLRDLRGNLSEMSHLVTQLLALNRVETETLPALGDLDLAELARRVTLEWIPVAMRKSIDLGYEGAQSQSIAGNEVLLQEVLRNLLDNAIKFTPDQGRITVRVEGDDKQTVLAVEDSGPGIPWSERARVFDRFYQIPGGNARGCGLGLSIVKKIASMHAARVTIEAPGGERGTAVVISFPKPRQQG